MPTITLYPSSYDALSSSTGTVTNQDAPIGQGVTNTSYAQIALKTGSGATTSAYYNFDASAIPAGATINSVTARAKAYINNTTSTRITTRTVQLYSGLTPKGNASTVSTSTTALTLTAGTWTRAELNAACIRMVAVRGSSSTSTSYYFRFYGAELVVDYSAPQRTLTIDNVAGADVIPSATAQYDEGSNVTVTIKDNLPSVRLDGTSITDQFVEGDSPTGGTHNGAPTSATKTSDISGDITKCIGYTAENPNTSAGNVYGSQSAGAGDSYVRYTFDTSSIPQNATILSIVCKVAGKAESADYDYSTGGSYSIWIVYGGPNYGDISESVNTTSTSLTTITLTCDIVPVSALGDIRLTHLVGYYGGITAGATLTITYSLPNDGGKIYTATITMDSDHTLTIGGSATGLFVKMNDQWRGVQAIYKKISGNWVEQTGNPFGDAANDTNSGYNIDIE